MIDRKRTKPWFQVFQYLASPKNFGHLKVDRNLSETEEEPPAPGEGRESGSGVGQGIVGDLVNPGGSVGPKGAGAGGLGGDGGCPPCMTFTTIRRARAIEKNAYTRAPAWMAGGSAISRSISNTDPAKYRYTESGATLENVQIC